MQKIAFTKITEFDLIKPSGLRSPVTSTNGENRHGTKKTSRSTYCPCCTGRNSRDAEHPAGSA